MLVDKKITSGKKLNALPLKKAIVKEVAEVAPSPASEAPSQATTEAENTAPEEAPQEVTTA
ncbi:MAG: hypothetical protein WAW92_01975 [Minisyncoccia bacterium]